MKQATYYTGNKFDLNRLLKDKKFEIWKTLKFQVWAYKI